MQGFCNTWRADSVDREKASVKEMEKERWISSWFRREKYRVNCREALEAINLPRRRDCGAMRTQSRATE